MSAKSGVSILGQISAARVKGLPCQVIIATFTGKEQQDERRYTWNSCTRRNLTSVLPTSDHDIVSQEKRDLATMFSHMSRKCVDMLPIEVIEHERSDDMQLIEVVKHEQSDDMLPIEVIDEHEQRDKGRRVRRDGIGIDGVYPNTNYCGKGTKATRYQDVGSDPADICCREHDECKLWIGAGETKYGYTNKNSLYVQVHCHCDKDFHQCLNMIDRIFGKERTAALNIQHWFFITIDMTCFMFAKKNACIRYKNECTSGWFGLTSNCRQLCVEYDYRYRAVQGTVVAGDIVIND